MSESSLASEATPIAPPAWTGPALLLAGGVCIGFAPIGLRLGLGEMGPFAIAFWRYVFALPILFCLVLVAERRLPVRPNRFLLVAGTCFALDIALWHWGLSLTTVANATFIVNLGNIGVGLAAWLFLLQRPTRIWVIAAMIALVGAAILSLGGEADGKTDLRGDLLALGAAVLVSGYMLASSVARRTIGALDAIFWLTAVEVIVGGLVVAVSPEVFMPERIEGFQAPLVLAVIVQVMGQGLIIAGLGRTAPAIAGVLVLVQPVVAAAISWRLFDEPLTGLQAGGALLILVGVFLAQRRATDKKASQIAVTSGID